MASNTKRQDVRYENDVENFEFSACSLHIRERNESNISCSYCKMHHPSNKCHVVTDVVPKKTILQQIQNVINAHHISLCQSPKGDEETRVNSYTCKLVNNYRGYTILQTAQAVNLYTWQNIIR